MRSVRPVGIFVFVNCFDPLGGYAWMTFNCKEASCESEVVRGGNISWKSDVRHFQNFVTEIQDNKTVCLWN